MTATRSSTSNGRTSAVHEGLRWTFFSAAALTVTIAPWMIGSVTVLAQQILAACALVTLIAGGALRRSSTLTPGAKAAWKTLAWPVVLGLGFLGLMWVQALNPSHRVAISGNTWELLPVGFSDGWPTSIAAPFDFLAGDWLPYKNAWRYLLIFGTGWVYATGLALGLIERERAHALLRVLGVNACLLALVCIVHRMTGSQETLWNYSETFDFTRSPVFFYKNHNGAYLAACLALVLGLAAMEKNARWRLGWHSGALGIWIATVSVNSRVATACATLWAVLYGVHWLKQQRAEGRFKFPGKAVAVVAGVVLLISGLVFATGGNRAVARFAPALSSPVDFLQGGHFRVIVRELGTELWSDRLAWGWGGGSYMYLFNVHQQRVPEIARWMYREQPNLNRLVSPTVNCDWIEFGVEYGDVGLGLLVAATLIPLIACLRWGAGKHPGMLFLLAGVSGVAIHAWFDYILRNPAILLLFLTMIVIATRISGVAPAKLSRRRRRSGGAATTSPFNAPASP